jgi:hypothetical protein
LDNPQAAHPHLVHTSRRQAVPPVSRVLAVLLQVGCRLAVLVVVLVVSAAWVMDR